MKKLLFLLFILPFTCLSQGTGTLEDTPLFDGGIMFDSGIKSRAWTIQTEHATVVSIEEYHEGETYIISVEVYGKRILEARSDPDKTEYLMYGKPTTKELWDEKFIAIKTKYFTPIRKS